MLNTAQMCVSFCVTGIWYRYMNNIVFVPSFSSKPFKHCPSFLHITFPHTFFLYQISVFKLPSGCFSGDTFCDGLKWYRFFFRVIFNNHVLLHYGGPGWFFRFLVGLCRRYLRCFSILLWVICAWIMFSKFYL